jgi:hypothetical protein
MMMMSMVSVMVVVRESAHTHAHSYSHTHAHGHTITGAGHAHTHAGRNVWCIVKAWSERTEVAHMLVCFCLDNFISFITDLREAENG